MMMMVVMVVVTDTHKHTDTHQRRAELPVPVALLPLFLSGQEPQPHAAERALAGPVCQVQGEATLFC